MKRILVLLLVLVAVFSLSACDDNGGKEGKTYKAFHSHLYYAAEKFSNFEYSVTINGDEAEFVQTTYETNENDSGEYTETQISRMVGTAKKDDGYYVVTVKKLYNSVKVSGAGAKLYKDSMVAMAQEQIDMLDSKSENYKQYKERYEMVVDLYKGKEVDASASLGEFDSVTYQVKLDDENGKMTELVMYADGKNMGGYSFEYDEAGVMIRSKEFDDDSDVWEVEYRENGTPSAFKFKNENENMSYTCDENGKVTKLEVPAN
jgi:Fe-S cluster assembly iron-binding protein IscA